MRESGSGGQLPARECVRSCRLDDDIGDAADDGIGRLEYDGLELGVLAGEPTRLALRGRFL